jgi:uncharacterized protein
MKTANEKNIGAILHLSALSQYIVPFGNYIFPIIIWSVKKNDSEFVDNNGKNILNFQLSIFMYTLILCLITLPILLFKVFNFISINDLINNHNNMDITNFGDITTFAIIAITGLVILGFTKIFEFFIIIYAAVKASNGEEYKYPMTIPFFK